MITLLGTTEVWHPALKLKSIVVRIILHFDGQPAYLLIVGVVKFRESKLPIIPPMRCWLEHPRYRRVFMFNSAIGRACIRPFVAQVL
jgi:hypothetical protein